MSNLLASTAGDENFVASPDGTSVYVAGNDGHVRVYAVAGGGLIHDWKIGKDLGAIAISPDGTQLLVVEQTPLSFNQTNDWPANRANVALYEVDTSSGYRQTFTYHAKGSDYTLADVAFTANNSALVTENILPGWSGGSNLLTFDLGTGVFVARGGYYSGASLTQATGGGPALVGELHLSSAVYNLLGADGKVIAGNGIYQHGVYGYAAGIEAFVGSGSSGRIAIVTGGGLHLYNGNFGYIANLARHNPNLGASPGIAFDSQGETLYAIDAQAHQIVGISLETSVVTQRIAIGDAYTFPVLQWGSELTLLADGHTFLVATDQGVVTVDRPTGNIPSHGADKLVGTAGNDTIAAGGGNDTVAGMAGNDVLFGNDDNDRLNGGRGNDRLYGGAGRDVLNGSDGIDHLYGGAGKDLLVGGAGKDVFVFAAGDSGATRTTADIITDFVHLQDKLDLSKIDTNPALGGAQPFLFIGEAAFSADPGKIPGELRFEHIDGTTYIEGDINHDGVADFFVALKGTITLSAEDFLL